MRGGSFKFIDLPAAAERLGTSRNQLLQWMAEGRIKPFSGSGQQSVFRSADVDRLAQELGTESEASAPAPSESPSPAPETTERVRTRKRDPIKLVGTRISMDSRWAEISDADIATWLDALEPVQFERVRKVCGLAVERLRYVVAALDAQERNLSAKGSERQG